MKRWLLVALAACSSKKQPPPPPAPAPPPKPDAAVAPPAPAMHSSKPIDLPGTVITGLELRSVLAQRGSGFEPLHGMFELHWHAPEPQDLAIVCRIEAYNLAGAGKRDDTMLGEYRVLYRSEPFVLDPKRCEVHFKSGARACYQDGTMTAGACPTGTFPPPKLPDAMAVDVQGASVRAMPSALELRALVTSGAAAEPALSVQCDGVAATAPVPLPPIEAGETRYITVPVAMPKPFATDPTTCELRVSTKARTLGTFCVAEGSTNPGPCPT